MNTQIFVIFSRKVSSKEKESIFTVFEALIDLYGLDKRGCRIITNYGVDGRQEFHICISFFRRQDMGRIDKIFKLKIFFLIPAKIFQRYYLY